MGSGEKAKGYQIIELDEFDDLAPHSSEHGIVVAWLEWLIVELEAALGDALSGIELAVIMVQSHGSSEGYPALGVHYRVEREDIGPLVLEASHQLLRVFSPLDRTPAWAVLKTRLPVGTRVHGKVVRVAPFGVFVQLDEADTLAVLLVTHFEDGDRRFELEDYPQVGAAIEAVVMDLVDSTAQVRLSTRRSDLDAAPSRGSRR